MPRKVPSFLVTQKQKLNTQRREKKEARKATNVAQYEREKAERESGGSKGYGYSMHQMTGSRSRTFREFIEIAEAITDADRALARSGVLSRRADELQKEIDDVTSGKKKTQVKSARKITKQKYEVREESETKQKPLPLTQAQKEREAQRKRLIRMIKHISDPHSDVAREEYELDEAKVPVTRQAGDFRYPGRTGEEKAERRANVLSKSPDPKQRRQANTIRNTIKTVADRDIAQASSDARQKLYRRQQTRANQLAHELMKARKGEG